MEIDSAFEEFFLKSAVDRVKPEAAQLLQLSADLESSDSSDSSDDEGTFVQTRDADSDLFEQSLSTLAGDKLDCEKEGRDETMKYTSNHADTGKLSGYSTTDPKINTMMDDYTGADNDDFMHEIIEDFGTKDAKTPANPDGTVLTKWNGERATRKFVATALKLNEMQVEGWMNKYFEKAWNRYDVNKAGSIQADMVPTYLRSTLGDFKAQFNLRSEDHLDRVLRDTA